MSSAQKARETFRFPVRVYYEDTDAAGVVYYANYLKYMERARTEWLSSLGFEPADLARRFGIVFVVHQVQIGYRRPARLGEELIATLTLIELRRTSMVAMQDVLRGDTVFTSARVALACLDGSMWRPMRIPGTLRGRLEKLL